MLISKGKINKIIGVSFLFLMLISIFFPFSKVLAGEYWFYIINGTASSIGRDTELDCNNSRRSQLQSYVNAGKGDTLFTECFKDERIKPLIENSEYDTFFKTHSLQKASVALGEIGESWWFIIKYIKEVAPRKIGDYFVAGPYKDSAECEKYLQASSNKNESVIFESCKQSTKKPATPDNTTPVVNTKTNYTLLAPLPDGAGGEFKEFESDPKKNPCPFGKYLNIMIKLFFGIAGVLAVVMIVMGGIQYMTSELISSKEEGKKSITNAIFGLLLALGAWLILNTINPDLLSVCLDNLPKAEITISPEGVTNAGSGVNVNGNIVKIKNGSAATCVGGPVNIPSDMGSGKICKDLLEKLQILKSKTSDWRITSAIRDGGAASSCHYSNSPNSGNCADLQLISSNSGEPGYTKENGSLNTAWGNFCIAVAQTGGLNFLNEASKVKNCEDLIAYKAYPQTTGPHLHVNYIGGQSSQAQPELYDSVSNTGNIIYVKIKNYDTQKNPHSITITRPSPNLFYEKHDNLTNMTALGIVVTLTQETYNEIKGTSVNISVSNKETDLGTKTLVVK